MKFLHSLRLFLVKNVYFHKWKLCTLILIYANLWSMFGLNALPPDGHLFHWFMLFIVAQCGSILAYILRLPSLLGMLVSGFLYGYFYNCKLDEELTANIRGTALMIILLRAGQHLDIDTLRKNSCSFFRFIIIPYFVEIFSVAGLTYYIFSMNFTWSLLTGFVMAAVSPAVVVPCMIRIQSAGLSDGKGLPTLIIAASSIWDALSVTGFAVCIKFIFIKPTYASPMKFLLQAPLQIGLGIIYGIIIGILLWYFPEMHSHQEDPHKNQFDLHRLLFLLLAALFAMFGSDRIDLSGAGPLAILILSFVASIRWRRYQWLKKNEEGLRMLWFVFKPYLFCLVGFNVRLEEIRGDIVLKGLICLMIGLIARSFCSFAMTYGLGLSYKERLFATIAWIPKATVQAAIGPVALNYARKDQDRHNATIIFTMAVLSVLITAPLGAIGIDCSSRFLLNKQEMNNDLESILQQDIKRIDETIEKTMTIIDGQDD